MNSWYVAVGGRHTCSVGKQAEQKWFGREEPVCARTLFHVKEIVGGPLKKRD